VNPVDFAAPRDSLAAMNRWTWVAVAAAAASLVAAVYLYADNRSLEREVAALRRAPAADADAPARASDPWATAAGGRAEIDRFDVQRGLGPIEGAGPELPEAPKESRLDRRIRRQQEVAAFLGRLDGETEEEYRQRIVPMMEMFLGPRREQMAELRRELEAKAGVNDDQRRQLDAAFDEVYDEVLAFTNAAITDGQLTPYQRNVAGMLEYAGGLGAILNTAESRIGTILTADQIQTIYGSGFEWAEYLGLSAPWERLTPPPPPGGGS
jgi:hypothetical protein